MNIANSAGGSKEPNKDVEKKLLELEQDIENQNISKSAHTDLPMSVLTHDLIKTSQSGPLTDDLYYFSGLALIAFSILMFFQHVHIGTGIMQALGFGAGGFGLLFVPLLVGIGMIVYNSKNKIGYGIVAVTIALIFYTVISSLIMTFSPVSLLGLIIMLSPLAVGGALVVKGIGGPKGIEHKLRKQGLIKARISSDSDT